MTTELERKLVPVSVSVKAAEPAVVLDGCSVVRVGVGLLTAVMVNVSALDVPPPGVGLVTVTDAVPAVATSAARIEAVTCVELTKVVVRVLPAKLTVAPLTKPVPFTVKVKAAEPAVAVEG